MTTHLKSLGELADKLRQVERQHLRPCVTSMLRHVGEQTVLDARERVVGRVTPLGSVGGLPAWQPLKQATIDRKEQHGLGKGGDPRSILWETGRMADSIGFRLHKAQKKVAIGTNDQLALYHTHGTIHIPPRPFLGPALIRTLERERPRLRRWLTQALAGRPLR